MTSRKFTKYALKGYVFAITLCAVRSYAAGDKGILPGNQELQYVAAGMANARQTFRTGRVVIRYQSSKFQEAVPEEVRKNLEKQGLTVNGGETSGDHNESFEACWEFRDPQIAVWVESKSNFRNNLVDRRHLVFDGASAAVQYGPLTKTDDGESGSPDTLEPVYKDVPLAPSVETFLEKFKVNFQKMNMGIISAPETIIKNGIWSDFPSADPRYHIGFGSWPLDKVFLDPKWQASYVGDDVIFGAHCSKVELMSSRGRATYWIDTDHSFLPRKVEREILRDGIYELLSSTEVPSLVSSGDVFLPGVTETRQFDVSKGTPVAKLIDRAEIVSFQSNPTDMDDKFNMVWPPKTLIQDDLRATHFITPAKQ